MNKISYRLVKTFLNLLAYTPLFVLYGISNVLYYVLQYLIGYRVAVVDQNLELVFPEKTAAERKLIRKKYYRHLADFIVEVFACSSISSRKLDKHVHIVNPELINQYHDQGRQIVSVLGHYANWEWTFGIAQYVKYRSLVVYKPLDNKIFDRIFQEVRSRFTAIPVSMDKSFRTSVSYIRNHEQVFLYLLADQSPAGNPNTWHFTDFLGVSGTPVFLGPEKIAQSFDAVFVFTDIQKVKRGHYEVRFETLCEDCKAQEPFVLTRLYLDRLEQQIRSKPEYWIWSHRRWKRRKV